MNVRDLLARFPPPGKPIQVSVQPTLPNTLIAFREVLASAASAQPMVLVEVVLETAHPLSIYCGGANVPDGNGAFFVVTVGFAGKKRKVLVDTNPHQAFSTLADYIKVETTVAAASGSYFAAVAAGEIQGRDEWNHPSGTVVLAPGVGGTDTLDLDVGYQGDNTFLLARNMWITKSATTQTGFVAFQQANAIEICRVILAANVNIYGPFPFPRMARRILATSDAANNVGIVEVRLGQPL